MWVGDVEFRDRPPRHARLTVPPDDFGDLAEFPRELAFRSDRGNPGIPAPIAPSLPCEIVLLGDESFEEKTSLSLR